MKLPDGSIHINGEVTEYETSINYPLEYRETTVTILKEFVDYCNERPRTSRADHLESLLISFIHKKMERYQ